MEHSQGEENSRRRRWLVVAAAATTTQPKNREVVVVGALVNVNSSRTMDSELSSQFVGIGLHLWMFFSKYFCYFKDFSAVQIKFIKLSR